MLSLIGSYDVTTPAAITRNYVFDSTRHFDNDSIRRYWREQIHCLWSIFMRVICSMNTIYIFSKDARPFMSMSKTEKRIAVFSFDFNYSCFLGVFSSFSLFWLLSPKRIMTVPKSLDTTSSNCIYRTQVYLWSVRMETYVSEWSLSM